MKYFHVAEVLAYPDFIQSGIFHPGKEIIFTW